MEIGHANGPEVFFIRELSFFPRNGLLEWFDKDIAKEAKILERLKF